MVKKMEQKLYLQNRFIELPKGFFGLSHVHNIDYCIEQIKAHPNPEKNPVFGYFLERGRSTKQILNQILPREEAERLKREHLNFRYNTLDDLLDKKKWILEGKYIVRDGLIINFNPNYSP